MSQDWIDDCMRFYGRVLTGNLGHWCLDWDMLPIDETCREFECCNCFKNSPDDEILDWLNKLDVVERSVARDDASSNADDQQKVYNENIDYERGGE